MGQPVVHFEIIGKDPEKLRGYYGDLFGRPYPFGDYHQAFVPDFNAGAMENPGCVTLRDTWSSRG